jgi:hypothetical protein
MFGDEIIMTDPGLKHWDQAPWSETATRWR